MIGMCRQVVREVNPAAIQEIAVRRDSDKHRRVTVLGDTDRRPSLRVCSYHRTLVARLSRNVSQSDHGPANSVVGHKAKERPGAGEEWLAATKHHGMEVEPILIDETDVG